MAEIESATNTGHYQYSPTTSVIFSRNFGSHDGLNVSTRCGFRLRTCQILFDRGLADSLTGGHGSTTPMGYVFRLGLQNGIHNGGYLIDVAGTGVGFGALPNAHKTLCIHALSVLPSHNVFSPQSRRVWHSTRSTSPICALLSRCRRPVRSPSLSPATPGVSNR